VTERTKVGTASNPLSPEYRPEGEKEGVLASFRAIIGHPRLHQTFFDSSDPQAVLRQAGASAFAAIGVLVPTLANSGHAFQLGTIVGVRRVRAGQE